MDGFQQENWLNLATTAHEWQRRIDLAKEHDRLRHVQLLQYNPVHEARLVEFGAKLPGVSRERDQLIGLASYLMAHGGNTYFGFGLHPYDRVTELWFDAVRVDLGEALGESRPWEPQPAAGAETSPNLLRNGSLDSLADWRLSDGVTLDAGEKHEGGASLRIESADAKAIRIHSQNVTLKPRTGYTLNPWVKTTNVRGNIGAQIYPYDFTKAATAPVEMLTARQGFQRCHRAAAAFGKPHAPRPCRCTASPCRIHHLPPQRRGSHPSPPNEMNYRSMKLGVSPVPGLRRKGSRWVQNEVC